MNMPIYDACNTEKTLSEIKELIDFRNEVAGLKMVYACTKKNVYRPLAYKELIASLDKVQSEIFTFFYGD